MGDFLLKYRQELESEHRIKIAILDEIIYDLTPKPAPLGIPYRKYMRGWHENQWSTRKDEREKNGL